MRSGAIDVDPEYTSTLMQETLFKEGTQTEAQLRQALATRRLCMTKPFGFNNTFTPRSSGSQV